MEGFQLPVLLRPEYSEWELCIPKTSAAMVLTMWNKLVIILCKEGFQLPVPSECSEEMFHHNRPVHKGLQSLQQQIWRPNEAVWTTFQNSWACFNGFLLPNPLWPSDAIWWHRSWSTLAQVMAWCLTAPNHYLNWCGLVIKGALWHSLGSNFKCTRY